jgi:hypothetical protein
VGQLTGGVAHDFNNLLTVVLGNADLLAEQSADRSAAAPAGRDDRAAAQRGAALTQQLLAFARKQPLDAERDRRQPGGRAGRRCCGARWASTSRSRSCAPPACGRPWSTPAQLENACSTCA